jgi:hypothetical protein
MSSNLILQPLLAPLLDFLRLSLQRPGHRLEFSGELPTEGIFFGAVAAEYIFFFGGLVAAEGLEGYLGVCIALLEGG